MIPLTAATKSHWGSNATTIATCWKVTRLDGLIVGFTDHVRALVVAGRKYSAIPGIRPSAVKTTGALAVDNLELDGAFEAAGITAAEAIAGKWDYAQVEIFQVNYLAPADGTYPMRSGRIGRISTGSISFRAELLGLMHKLQQQVGRVYAPNCDATLGDTRCGKNLATMIDGIVHFTVSAAANRRAFTAAALTQATDWFTFGRVDWTLGLNVGEAMEVKAFSTGGIVELRLGMPFTIAIGDEGDITVGCDHTRPTCKTKFANVYRYRGHWDVPGTDRMVTGK